MFANCLLFFFVGAAAFIGPASQAASSRFQALTWAGEGIQEWPANAAHFPFVRDNTPKGGTLRLGTTSMFATLMPEMIGRKAEPLVGSLTFQALGYQANDGSDVIWGLIAKDIEIAEDRKSIIARLRPEARWQDGQPITAEDVLFSYQFLRRPNVYPYMREGIGAVTSVRALDAQTVFFELPQPANREQPEWLLSFLILPKHYYENSADPSALPPMGSGPYRVSSFEIGRQIVFSRDRAYWAKDLPMQAGLYNFDRVIEDVYYSDAAMFEAFKAGELDYFEERNLARWSTGYGFAAARERRALKVVKTGVDFKPPDVFIFNLRRPKFADRRIRAALEMAFNFEFLNQGIWYSAYQRPRDLFTADDLMPHDAPAGEELQLLEPLRALVPPEVFGAPWQPTVTTAESEREHKREAFKLLLQAGCATSRDGAASRLLDPTGQPFKFEILLKDSFSEGTALNYAQSLKAIGVEASVRTVDGAQYQNRLDQLDFDSLLLGFGGSSNPGNELPNYLGSSSANAPNTDNLAGIADPAVDRLIEYIQAAHGRATIAAGARALDRVLMWNHYFLPVRLSREQYAGYWNKLGFNDLEHQGHLAPAVTWWSVPAASEQ
jgi:microcin C transport system substrate-binding protein